MKNVILIGIMCLCSTMFAQDVQECAYFSKVELFLTETVKVASDKLAVIKTAHNTACIKIKAIRKDSTQSKEARKVVVKTAMDEVRKVYKANLTKEQLKQLHLKVKEVRAEKKEKRANKAENLTADMASLYKLNEEQISKLTAINIQYKNDKKSIRLQYTDTANKEAKKAAVKELNKNYKAAIKVIFTTEQFNSYLANKKAKRKAATAK